MAAPKVLIPFYSRTGTIESLAKAVAEGAEAEGAEVRLRRARELVGHDIMSTGARLEGKRGGDECPLSRAHAGRRANGPMR